MNPDTSHVVIAVIMLGIIGVWLGYIWWQNSHYYYILQVVKKDGSVIYAERAKEPSSLRWLAAHFESWGNCYVYLYKVNKKTEVRELI